MVPVIIPCTVTQTVNSFPALKVLTPVSVAVKCSGLKSVELEFRSSLTLLVPTKCISCVWCTPEIGLCGFVVS